MRVLVLILVLSFSVSAQVVNYTYTLPVDANQVSLGVKDSTGRLIRTLFTGQHQNAGTYSGFWDGTNDNGTPASNPPYTLVVLYGSPTFAFQGEIGNTEEAWGGLNRWESVAIGPAVGRFTFIGGTAWFGAAYTEGRYWLANFPDTDPNNVSIVSPLYFGQNISTSAIANDGRNVYYVSNSPWGSLGFITKFDGHTGRPVYFTDPSIPLFTGNAPGQGAGASNTVTGTTVSQIDIASAGCYPNCITGMAVQRTGVGTLLASAHGDWWPNSVSPAAGLPNPIIATPGTTIKFFNKDTGLSVGNPLTIRNPRSMAFDPSGNLWVVTPNPHDAIGAYDTSTLYMISNPSGTNTASQPIANLSFPIAVDVNEITGHIYVLDGGSSQQVKEFDTSYNLVRTYGTPGGYTDCNPTVTNQRLNIDQMSNTGFPGYYYGSTGGTPNFPTIVVEDNGDVWFSDLMSTSSRIQHIHPNGATFNYIAQVIYETQTYGLTISKTQPTRLFVGWLEYQVDWSKQNVPGDPMAPGGSGMWKLVRNWNIGLAGACGQIDDMGMAGARAGNIGGVEQLSNGHVYAWTAGICSASNTYVSTNCNRWYRIFEMPADGVHSLRKATDLPYVAYVFNGGYFTRTGDILWGTQQGNTSATGTNYIWKVPMTGFDSNNNPIYGPTGSPQTVLSWPFVGGAATANGWSGQEPTSAGNWTGPGANYEPTTGGVLAYQLWSQYDKTKSTYLPHLGGIIPPSTTPKFFAMPEICMYGNIPQSNFPCTGGTGNIGPGVFTAGHYILSLYAAQGAPGGGAYYQLYNEDGMFIGSVGVNLTYSLKPLPYNQITIQPTVLYNAACGWQCAQSWRVGVAQNSGSANVIQVGNDLFFMLMSESGTTPLLFYKISNLSSVQELAGTGNLGDSISLSQAVPMTDTLSFKVPFTVLSKAPERREERKEQRRTERKKKK